MLAGLDRRQTMAAGSASSFLTGILWLRGVFVPQ